MTDLRKTHVLLATIILLGCAVGRGAEPTNSPSTVTFENGSAQLLWPAPDMPRMALSAAEWESLQPTYAAGITFRGSQNIAAPGLTVWGQFVNERQAQTYVGLKQQRFLSALRPDMAASSRSGRWTPEGCQDDPNYCSVLFYAGSLEAAREMAQAYLRFAWQAYERERKPWVDQVERLKNRIAFAQKRIPELDEQLKTAETSFEGLRKNVPYRTAAEATAAIGELDRMINVARVDLAGIRATIDAIHSYGRPSQAVAAKLEVMLVEESIAMRAAEARKAEATSLRTQAAQFVDLSSTLETGPREKRALTQALGQLPQELQGDSGQLAKLEERAPVPVDDKVFLYRVKPGPRDFIDR